MMKVLLISNNYIVIKDGRCWCDPNFYYILKRFSYLGDIYIAGLERVDCPTYVELDFIPEKRIHFIKKARLVPKIHNIRILESLVQECDLIIGYNPCVNAESAFWLAKKYQKKYMTYLVACVWDSLWNHSFKGMLAAPGRYLSVRHVVRNSDYVLYVTQEFLQRRYPNNKLNIGCSDVQITPSDEIIVKQRLNKIANTNLTEDTINIATTAAVYVKYKGQRFVIKALGELERKGKQNYHYYLIGGGDPSSLQKIARANGVEDKITFLGQQPHSMVMSILDTMDVYIHPSLQEGLPRSVVEAMSRGLTCIGARTGAIPELLDEDFIVDRKSVRQIVDRLETLDVDKMKKACEDNLRVASEYEASRLAIRRNRFFDAVINDLNR